MYYLHIQEKLRLKYVLNYYIKIDKICINHLWYVKHYIPVTNGKKIKDSIITIINALSIILITSVTSHFIITLEALIHIELFSTEAKVQKKLINYSWKVVALISVC